MGICVKMALSLAEYQWKHKKSMSEITEKHLTEHDIHLSIQILKELFFANHLDLL